jgi:DNA-binding transcriptional LysR family regulator
MNIDAINTFLLLSETGNFSQVAQKSNLTQSTISARIRVLETDLGVKLFERTPTGVYLTEAGKKFYGYAATLRQTWQQGRQELARTANSNETFGLGLHMTMWRRFMPGWLSWMREKNKDLSVRVEADYSERLVEYVSQYILDLAIIHMPTGMPGLEIEPFLDDELVMVSRIKRDFVTCDPKDYVFVDWSYGYREEHKEKLPDFDMNVCNIGYGRMALEYARTEDCFTYLPREYIATDLHNGTLHIVANAPILSRPSYLVFHSRPKNSSLLKLAIDRLRACSLESKRL